MIALNIDAPIATIGLTICALWLIASVACAVWIGPILDRIATEQDQAADQAARDHGEPTRGEVESAIEWAVILRATGDAYADTPIYAATKRDEAVRFAVEVLDDIARIERGVA